MKAIKKVEVVPLDYNEGKIIDSASSTDDKTKNTYSMRIVDQKVGNTYSKTEVDTKLDGKSNTGHTHTKSEITDFDHNHDDRYYTETESDNKYQPKVLSGTNAPSSSLGNNGDVYLQY